VIPKGSTKLWLFLGQFAEAQKICVFTVEYSVRTAQIGQFMVCLITIEVTKCTKATPHNPRICYLQALKQSADRNTLKYIKIKDRSRVIAISGQA